MPQSGERRRLACAAAMFAAAVLVAVAYAMLEAQRHAGYLALQVFVVRFLGAVMAASFVAMLLYGIKTRLRT